MNTRRLIIAALWFNCLAVTATAETTVIRQGACTAQAVYLLASNSGALIKVEPDTARSAGDHVIVFRRQPLDGWASQRLLKRFDLAVSDDGARIINSGAFCTETK